MGEKIVEGISKCIVFLVEGSLQFESLFIVTAMGGIFVTMGGNKTLGTRLTSGAIMIYIVLKVLSIC